MSKSRKRRRKGVADDGSRAECPFSIRLIYNDSRYERDWNEPRKRRRHAANGIRHETSPLVPAGKFKTHETLHVYYSVDPCMQWDNMTVYKNFLCMYGVQLAAFL